MILKIMTQPKPKKDFNISFHCKKIKPAAMDDFTKTASALGSEFLIEYIDDVPVISKVIAGNHEIFRLMEYIEKICSTVVEQIGYDKDLM